MASCHLLRRGEGGRDPDVPVAWVSTVGEGRTSSRHRDPCLLGQRYHAGRRAVGHVEADEVPTVRISPGRRLAFSKPFAQDGGHLVELGSQNLAMPTHQRGHAVCTFEIQGVPQMVDLVGPMRPLA